MKRIFVFAMLLIVCNTAFAQIGNIDSIQKAYNKNRQDTTLVQLYFLKSNIIRTANPDSGLAYSRKAFALAHKIHYKKGEVGALWGIAAFRYASGDIPGSLKATFEVFPEALRIHAMDIVSLCYNLRGMIYGTLGDNKKVLDNFYAAKAVAEKYHYNYLSITELSNISKQYLDMNRLDSALYYTQKDYDFAWKIHILNNLGYLIRNFGMIEFKKGNLKGAIDYYHKSLSDSSARNDHYLQSEDYRRIAEAQQKMNNIDSCIDNAKKAYHQAQLSHRPDQVRLAATFLTSAYKSKNDYKNAFDYQQIAVKAQDSLFSRQKTLQVQNLVYNEQQRERAAQAAQMAYANKIRYYTLLGVIGVILVIAIILFFANNQRKKAHYLLQQQKEEIEAQRDNLEQAYSDLKTTQKQLVQSEKMASLGELTAGIAHEIQNPLNFVNNFSEVNTELLDEMEQEIDKGHFDEVKNIAGDIKKNQEKISQHGKRADFIVKGMLQHSRTSTGEKQLTNLNVLADEFFKLSFHGLRAKDKSFNAEMVTHFDGSLPQVNIAQQDIGRVLLNLFNNAFYAVNQKKKTAGADYKPEVSVSTGYENGQVIIKVKDNGNGIPDSIKDKIMQPFFTTKPTGEGTGLGLSLSYDIVVKGHGGSIDIRSTAGQGAEFIITLPVS